jgi:hypothetical protein
MEGWDAPNGTIERPEIQTNVEASCICTNYTFRCYVNFVGYFLSFIGTSQGLQHSLVLFIFISLPKRERRNREIIERRRTHWPIGRALQTGRGQRRKTEWAQCKAATYMGIQVLKKKEKGRGHGGSHQLHAKHLSHLLASFLNIKYFSFVKQIYLYIF